MPRTGSRQTGQTMVEFAMTFSLLMLLIVLTSQVAIYLHHRNSLQLAAKEGAFEASLAGHTTQDGEAAAQRLWTTVEPGGSPITVKVERSGQLVTVTASGTAPTLVPVPIQPFTALNISARAAHTVEVFEPGSAP